MNKIKIGIDIDEVVAEFMKKYFEFHNKKNNTSLVLENLRNYHLWECGIHNSKEESIKDVLEFQNSADFDDIELIDGAKEGINFLSENYEIFFITSRPSILKEKTEIFFRNNFPNNNFQFIFSGEIYGGKSKSDICEDLGVQFMIEDNAEYALSCAKNQIKTFLLEKPWNKNYENHNNLIKVQNWNEILEKLNLVIENEY
jgi:uncharacterized HAD superfamily protein